MGNAPVKTVEVSTEDTHQTDTLANPLQGLPTDSGTEMVEARASTGRAMITMTITGGVTLRTKAEETAGVEGDSKELQENPITVSCCAKFTCSSQLHTRASSQVWSMCFNSSIRLHELLQY